MLIRHLIFLLSVTASVLFSQANNSYSVAVSTIKEQNIYRHMQFLASDIFEGRGTGTTGGNLAAKYIALEYAKYGLKPIGDANTFYQYVPMHGSIALPSSSMILYLGGKEIHLKLNDDYLLYRNGQQTFTPIPLQLVFVGYGIYAPEFDYNDYQSIDVEGKIVVFFSGEPQSDDPDFFDGDNPTVYSYPSSKQKIAISRGAAGSILIPVYDNFDWQEQQLEFSFEDITLAYSASNNLSILINPKMTEILFEGALYSFDETIEILNQNRLKSFPLKSQLSFKGEFKQRDFLSPNILGMIEGSNPDLKDSYVILSAHYDHLGTGNPVEGDSIYNGALDNAIGISVLLELASAYIQLDIPPKRSIIFISLTGEEKGLLGSIYYTDHPVVPLYKTVANINIDGVAMFRDFKSVVGIGSEYSTLSNFLDSSAARFDLIAEDIPPQFKNFEAFNRSDQIVFATAGIPSLLVLEGIKNKNKSEEEVLNAFINYMIYKYHTPFDDLSQKIDYTAAVQHAQILFDLSFSIANSEAAPEWKEDTPYSNARLRSIAERK